MARPRGATEDRKTVEKLLRAGEAKFGEGGFDRVRLEDIAADAGISRPSLLYHFESKDELYRQVVKRAFRDLRDHLLAAMKNPGGFVRRLDVIVNQFLLFLETRPALAQIILRELMSGSTGGFGYRLVMAEILTLLRRVEKFTLADGGRALRPELRVPQAARQALLMVASAALVKVAAGSSVARWVWGDADHTWHLATTLFLKKEEGFA